MHIMETVGAIFLLLSCICLIFLCMSQDTKSQSNMTSAVTGGSGNSFYGKNEGRSKEAKLIKVTKIFTFVFFGITLALNIIPLFVN